ncbi:hypothetical protein DFJ63DRAFT_282914 [Scheffersomyces coipomensis]|uniref:uncharacterized protein n=1 Tax=Scheffersomyces coipomensis TaxID=1788519 RepID=UPI00315D68DB
MSLAKSIAVFGGNGFLGRKICEIGVQKGYQVTSFSRSGEPPQAIIHQPWIKQVEWESADLFDASSYQSKLSKFGTIVHSVGILFENQSYKKAMNSNINFLSDIQNFANSLKGSNPMKKGEEDHNSYEAIQRDSAVLLADTFITEQKEVPDANPTFIYISADQQVPMVPSGYITTKREAEFELSCKEGLRSISVRPGIMYEEKHAEGGATARDYITTFLKCGYNSKQYILGNSIPMLNQLVRPVVSTDKVAKSIYEKIEDSTFKGIVTLDEIYKS